MSTLITEERVRRAAHAIHLAGWTYQGEHEPGCWCDDCERVCTPLARAALMAALSTERGE